MYPAKKKILYPIALDNDLLFIKRTLSLQLDDREDDDFINMLIQPATDLTEGLINQDIALTNNVIKFDHIANYNWIYAGYDSYYNFGNNSGNRLEIPQGNFNAINSIVIEDTSTLVTAYTVEKSWYNFKIIFDPHIEAKHLTLDFNTGFSKMQDIPRGLYMAIIVKTCDLFYQQRGSYLDTATRYANAWEDMCAQYKLL